jgi:hypothetical protein
MNQPTPVSQIRVDPNLQVAVVFSADFLQNLCITLETMPTALKPLAAVQGAQQIRAAVFAAAAEASRPKEPKPAGKTDDTPKLHVLDRENS